MSKVFKTINYEGSNGWEVTSFNSDTTGVASVGQPQLVSEPSSINTYTEGFYDTTTAPNYKTISVLSYNQGSYDNFGHEYPTALVPPINHAGFDRKENKYVANLINESISSEREVSFGQNISGIKGFYAVIMQTDSGTDVGGMKELFAVSSDYVESSY